VKPKGALYVFPKIDLKKFSFKDDEQFTLDLLTEQKILVVPGSGFNAFDRSHFRIVFLPNTDVLNQAMNGITDYLDEKRIPEMETAEMA
jgi:alanine-synthesizing transaminase